MLLLKRLLSALLVLLGVAVTVVGGWFLSRVGSDGTATFTLRPTSTSPIVLEPTLLNHLTVPTVVKVTPASGQGAWVGAGSGADATAAIGDAAAVRATGVDVRGGTITTTSTGSGAAKGLTSADLWRQHQNGTTPITWTVPQSQTPDTLVVAAQGADPVREISVSWTRKSWFFQSLVVTLVGVIVLVVGALTLLSTLRSRRRPTTEETR